MMVAMHGASLRQGEGTGVTDTTTPTIVIASPHSPPTSPIVLTSSTMVSKTHASGFIATPSPSMCQADPTPPRRSTFW
jgi:hypothetical protein